MKRNERCVREREGGREKKGKLTSSRKLLLLLHLLRWRWR